MNIADGDEQIKKDLLNYKQDKAVRDSLKRSLARQSGAVTH